MADYLTTDTELTSIANAIRTKGGTSAALEYPADFVSAINAIPTDGGGEEEKTVIFIDYDGTVVYSYTPQEFASLSALPANPSHTGLTAQGWNWTLADAKSYVGSYGALVIGQVYITSSGATELDIVLENGHLSPYVSFYIKGTGVFDWGDGSPLETVTGTSLSTIINTQHVYAAAGAYTIKFTMQSSDGQYELAGNTTVGSRVVWAAQNTSYVAGNDNAIYQNSLRAIRTGSKCYYFPGQAFWHCENIETVTLSNDIISGNSNITYSFCDCKKLKAIVYPDSVAKTRFLKGSYNFNNCYNLKYVSMPNGCNVEGLSTFLHCQSIKILTFSSLASTVPTYLCQYCYSLETVVLPSGVTKIGAYAFYNCRSLRKINIPSSITEISGYALEGTWHLNNLEFPNSITSFGESVFKDSYLSSITLPQSVTSIGNVFAANSNLKEIHMSSTTPPTINNNTFSNIYYFVIYVPYSADHSILEAYQTATNWSTYASKMQEEPQ